jgi:chromosome partitioning protein
MNTTLVINPKGGVGKTTLAINLASYFAANGISTTIVDYDPQRSSLEWLRRRSPSAPRIYGANAAPRSRGARSEGRRYVPSETQQLILDAPAGTSKLLLQDLLSRANGILIPVGPSSIDIHATADFIKDLLLIGRIRHRRIQVAIVANRVRASEAVYLPLERFGESLRLSFVARLPDSRVYVDTAERGVGIFEANGSDSDTQRAAFVPIVRWVEAVSALRLATANNVVHLLPSIA